MFVPDLSDHSNFYSTHYSQIQQLFLNSRSLKSLTVLHTKLTESILFLCIAPLISLGIFSGIINPLTSKYPEFPA